MNLNFASPIYLLGILGLAIPVLIHLLTRRQQRHLRFSAVYLLFQSQKRSIKRSAPNRLLLLLLRCLAIAFLSLALANPIFSFSGDGDILSSNPSATVFILDDSYSMGSRSEETSLYSLALDSLRIILRKMPPESQYSLVLASKPARILQGWTSDRAVAERLLSNSHPSYQTTHIGQAFNLAFGLLESVSKKEKRIFLITDLTKNGWAEEEFSDLPEHQGVMIQLMDLSERQTGTNLAAIQDVEVSQEFLTNSRIIRIKTRVNNLLAGKPLNRLRLTLKVNGEKQTEGIIDLPPKSVKGKEFSLPLQGSETLQGEVVLQDDALLVDNIRFFTYQPDQAIKVLVVDGDPKTIEHQSETFYLERALNPFSTALSNIEPTVSTLSELPLRDLYDYSVIILCNIRELPFDYEIELENFVLRGGALFISMGDQVDPKYYNEKLGNLLPVKLKSLQQVGRQGEPFRLLVEPSEHQVLSIFSGQTLEEMKSIRFTSLYSVEPREGRPFTVPQWFANKSPALIESDLGKGKVILFTSSLDRDWNSFPIQPTFLPWVQRWIKYSARSLESITRQDLLVGEPFTISGKSGQWFVQTPGGQKLILNREGENIVFDETLRPGVYRLYRGPEQKSKEAEPGSPTNRVIPKLPAGSLPAGGFTVNVDTRESLPGKISEEEIQNLLGGVPIVFSRGSPSSEPLDVSEGLPLTTPLFFMVACLFLVEGWLVRRE